MGSYDSLVQDLSAQLSKVSVFNQRSMWTRWLLIASVSGAIWLWFVGPRPDLSLKMQDVSFVSALFFLISALMLTSRAAIHLAMGWFESGRLWRELFLILSLFAVAMGLYAYSSLSHSAHLHSDWTLGEALGCCLRISAGALLPQAFFAILATRSAPTRLVWLSNFSWLASAITVSIVSQLNCPIDDLMHVLVGHGAMVLAVWVGVTAIMTAVLRMAVRRALTSRLTGLSVKNKLEIQ